MSPESDQPVEYFFNTKTKQVEKGRQSSWEHVMGPYSTREEAEGALEIARHRTEAWDDDDDRWSEHD